MVNDEGWLVSTGEVLCQVVEYVFHGWFLMDITMLFKNLHTLCPLHLNAITQDLLFSNFVFFLLDPCPVDWAIGTCPGTYTFSHCRLLFLPRKVDDQMCCTMCTALHIEKFLSLLSFKSNAECGCNATAVHFQFVFTYQANSSQNLACSSFFIRLYKIPA